MQQVMFYHESHNIDIQSIHTNNFEFLLMPYGLVNSPSTDPIPVHQICCNLHPQHYSLTKEYTVLWIRGLSKYVRFFSFRKKNSTRARKVPGTLIQSWVTVSVEFCIVLSMSICLVSWLIGFLIPPKNIRICCPCHLLSKLNDS